MQGSKTVSINGNTYQIFNIPPTVALKNYLRLQSLLLGPVGEAIGSAGSLKDVGSSLDKEIDLGKALGKLGENIKPEELTALFKELIELGAKDHKGMAIVFEVHFLGSIGDVFGVVKEVISFNYPNFFGMLFGLVNFEMPTPTTLEK